MKYYEKFLIQFVCCCLIFSGVKLLQVYEIKTLKPGIEYIAKIGTTNYTADDIIDMCKDIKLTIVNAPSVISSAIISANNINKFQEPIDEVSKDNTYLVYSIDSGIVISCGINKEYNKYIAIKYDNKTAIYGNLSEIYVVPNEKVHSGQIIGNYDENIGKEFYFCVE